MNDLTLPPGPFRRLATSIVAGSTKEAGDRTIDYLFSDESVARDGNTIASDGWELDEFLANPVFLWAHDSEAPPIGRVTQIAVRGAQLVGTVRYASAEEYPFADTIFRLVKGGFVNATSVSWLPIEWRKTADKSRPGGIDFKRQTLLEISNVPVPALSSALAIARDAGIDTKPLFDWATRALDLGGFAVVPRLELEALRKEASMPKAAPKTPAVETPAADLPAATSPATREAPKIVTKRGLSSVCWLAYILSDLNYLHDSAVYEKASEGDDSVVPDELLAALKSLGETLVKMTVEEVGEMLAGKDLEEDDLGVLEMGAPVASKRQAFGLLRRLSDGALASVSSVLRDLAAGRRVFVKTEEGGSFAPLVRAGRVLSAENERCLREALDLHGRACDMVRSVCDKNGDDDPEDDDDSEEERALRARKANARRLKHVAPAA